ncbi:MAG: DNA double-strand break repair nuclease NurA [Anaerolineae bacterium]|nr:DNA double-strand break repair nuclease NurA [Anaerolineae bacterium]
MFHSKSIKASLEAHRSRFQVANQHLQAELDRLQGILAHWANQPVEALDAALVHSPWPGARPTKEQTNAKLVTSFTERWQHHQQARAWALQILEGVTTFAVDGSQLSPPKEFSIPVGLVQVGWFKNHHTRQSHGRFEKDATVTVLGPEELEVEGSVEEEVGWRRFQAEVAQLHTFITDTSDSAKPTVAFFDGSFILSFIQRLPMQRRQAYLQPIRDLLATSEQVRIPLVAYVDLSRSRDLLNMLLTLTGEQRFSQLTDAQLLSGLMEAWGDRCRFYTCARSDRFIPSVWRDYYADVVFTYLQTTSDGLPARIELPRWVLEDELQEWVLDVIRAECVVGLGYPYTLASADAVAVISSRDRARFTTLFQQFAEEADLDLRQSRKEISKRWYRR